ncbi:lipase [Nocardia sp. 2]|uniref:Lipase n=1 Tax=Nocardia acididurans TaxID=2802282 RepID=A0ABS1MGY6_9NOCA|nr:lipase family protein [Nocardia acididurans]MBL1079933.1 lipase [Nocardia acididurans]
MDRLRVLVERLVAIAAVTGVVIGAGSGISIATPPIPMPDDQFYYYDGNLADVPPGTVLRTRPASISLAPLPFSAPLEATQALYRTTNERDEPSATVTTIVRPPQASGPVKLVSYQLIYNSVGWPCDASYLLTHRMLTSPNIIEAPIIASLLAAGYTLVISDYLGPTFDFGAGRESGDATLDGVRAAEQVLNLPASTPVGLLGYSGASIPTEFAAEQAAEYAPELNIVAAAAGGVPVNSWNEMPYIIKSPIFANAVSLMVLGLAHAENVDLTPYLSPEGIRMMNTVADFCQTYGGLPNPTTLSALLLPQYQDYTQIPLFQKLFDDMVMGGSIPRMPLLLGVGNTDGYGDDLAISGDVRALASKYCRGGDRVQYSEYPGFGHIPGMAPFGIEAVNFMNTAFAGAPTPTNCDALT